MSNTGKFAQYVEALCALSSVDKRQRMILRKAVEASNAATEQAKTQVVDQQRMYDRTVQNVDEAKVALAELRSMLGLPKASAAAPAPHLGTPPQLVQIREQVGSITRWATETKPIAESLLRTRRRLAEATRPVDLSAATPAVPTAPPRKTPVGLVAAALLVVIAIIFVLIAL